jgi:hypothetical protein
VFYITGQAAREFRYTCVPWLSWTHRRVVSMDALWPELAGQRRVFEVVVTVPREDGGEPLVPRALPPGVLGCWSADQVVASVSVLGSRPSRAVTAVEALVPELAQAAGAVVTVRAAYVVKGPDNSVAG